MVTGKLLMRWGFSLMVLLIVGAIVGVYYGMAALMWLGVGVILAGMVNSIAGNEPRQVRDRLLTQFDRLIGEAFTRYYREYEASARDPWDEGTYHGIASMRAYILDRLWRLR